LTRRHDHAQPERWEHPYVDNPTALEALIHRLRHEPRIGVDTESDGFYVYKEKVCLVQISVPGADVILDPLAIDLSPLSVLFEDPHIEKIFHASEYDILCLKRDYGFQIENIFDTMVAARYLGYTQVGLAGLIERHYHVKLDKKLQRADWGRRPLTQEHLDYARKDTHYLLRLREILSGELDKEGYLQDAQEEFNRLSALQPQTKGFDHEGFWSITGARALDGTSARVLKELWLFREKKSEAMNRAPFRVIPEQLLLKLAAAAPTGRAQLRQYLTPYLLHRFGDELLDVVQKGLAAAPIEPPATKPGERWDRKTMARYEALRKWRREESHKRKVDADIILPTETLKTLAKEHPVTEDALAKLLSPAQRRRWSEPLLSLLQKHPTHAKKG
jgi:ribonuclease D